MRALCEGEGHWGDVDEGGEDGAEGSVGDDVAVAVMRVEEARGAGSLGRREQGVQGWHKRRGPDEVDVPNCDFVCRQGGHG